MKYNIVLIGAMGIGKSTISNLICKEYPNYSVLDSDEVKHSLVAGLGYNSDEFEKKLADESWTAAYKYARSFLRPSNLKNILSSAENNHIINIGADLIDWTDSQDLIEIQDILREYPNVIFLAFSDDIEETRKELSKRVEEREHSYNKEELEQVIVYNNSYILSSCFSEIAKHKILTKGKSEIQIADEIIQVYSDSLPT